MTKDQAQAVLDGVRERIEWLEENVSPLIMEMNPEGHKLRKPEVPDFAQYMLEQYPPEPFVFPDGHVEVASPWGLALREVPNVRGGRELYRQIVRGMS